MSIPKEVIVAGGGIVGMNCAIELQRQGCSVTVVDPRAPGDGCSFGNAGNVVAGAVVPFSMPGNLLKIPSWVLSPYGPLSISLLHLPRLMPWLLRWLKASHPTNVRQISKAMHALHTDTFDLYLPLLRELGEPDLIKREGQLYVSRRAHGADGDALSRALRTEAGIRIEAVSGGQIQDIAPALSKAYCSGIFFPENGFCANPHRLVQVLAAALVARGGRITRDALVGVERSSGGGGTAILKSGARQRYDGLVIAAGVWSNRLVELFGVRVPLEAERGYHITLPESGISLNLPVTNYDLNISVTPMEMGLRITGGAEFAGLDAKPGWHFVDRMLELGAMTFPGLQNSGASKWAGMRPSIPDGLPVLDRAPGERHVIFAFGNGHYGLTEAPMMAKLVKGLMMEEQPSIDISPYSISRFRRPPSPATGPSISGPQLLKKHR
ncbi:glycine/D-amino acid oxidase, deaminating [Rhizobium leguminosarum bv. trifolii WSM597]|uniref:Glycine/D-amino acid oxidase, deaminating n=1 Tax=Rhizobium leguminosarum bv. trifolii WSM597 TaxID=754764 RepID=I9XDJ2_RHILT|nr:FAD-binding oxidoreductase [Rhizobium leguminosarum]EJB07151.1 glycine/D-amino acid oxidase, deaminating [Rhizobium leguminosarum bv. trifolii WSM597]